MINTPTPDLVEIERMMQIACGELVLVRGKIRMEATGKETPVEFYLPSRHAPKAREVA